MANVDNPHGFRPTMRNVYGGASIAIPAHKLVGLATAIFINDCVAKATAGTKKTPCVTSAAAAYTPGTTPTLGVSLNYGAASTATDHLVIPATGNVFEAQDNNNGQAADGGSAGTVAADINKNANIILGAGSATTQLSGHEVNQATILETNTLDVHILGLYDVPDNAFGSWARLLVTFNRPSNADQTVGVN